MWRYDAVDRFLTSGARLGFVNGDYLIRPDAREDSLPSRRQSNHERIDDAGPGQAEVSEREGSQGSCRPSGRHWCPDASVRHACSLPPHDGNGVRSSCSLLRTEIKYNGANLSVL
jgi:hypothetical protein